MLRTYSCLVLQQGKVVAVTVTLQQHKLLRLFRLGSSGQECNCDSKTIQTAIPSCFALNHRPVSNLDLLSLSNTLCRGYFEPPMNIPHVQLGNTSSKKMVRKLKRSQPNTYSRTTSTDSAFALEDIHFAGSPLSR